MPRSLRFALRQPEPIGVKAILTYHSIDESASIISVASSQLDRHLGALQSRGVRIVPLATLRLVPREVDAVALTFDDGFANFATAAAPVLLAHSAPATVFVIPSYVGGANDWEANDSRTVVPHLDLMSWAEIAQVRSQGFEIGGHSHTHRSLRGLHADVLEHEVGEAAAAIRKRVGADPVAFAFPYGDYDSAAMETVARRYAIACTTELRLLSDTDAPHALPRLDMYYFREGQMLARWGTPAFSAYVGARRFARNVGNIVRRSTSGSRD